MKLKTALVQLLVYRRMAIHERSCDIEADIAELERTLVPELNDILFELDLNNFDPIIQEDWIDVYPENVA